MIRTYLFFQPQAVPKRDNAYWTPATDLYQCGNELIIRLEAAGMKLEDFSLSIEDSGTVLITGRRIDRTPKEHYVQMEIPFGEFQVAIEMPRDFTPDHERVSAVYENGFLIVRCPKRKAQKITIQSSN